MALTYSYPSGRLATTTVGGVSDTRTYDSYGYLQSYTATYTPSGGVPTVLYSYTLTRDNGSRIVGKTETVQGVTDIYDYAFDTSGRLTEVKKNGVVYSSYVYDSNGNRTSGTTAGAAFTATYDDQDRMLTYNTRVYIYDADGNLYQINWGAAGTGTYTFDVFGKLKQALLTTGKTYYYHYDGKGRRARKAEDATQKYRFVYEEGERVAISVSSGNIYKECVYGTNVNSPDYMNAYITDAGRYRIIKDHLGSPRLVVNTSTGVAIQRMDYNDLGEVTADTNAGFQPYGFAGGIYDGNTKLVKFGAREYDARAAGRWLTKDPIRFAGGDTNLFGYVAQDPVNWVDPSGLKIAYGNSQSRSLIQPLIEQLMQSPAGAALINQLESSSATYTLNAISGGTSSPGEAFRPIVLGSNGTVNVDVCPNVGIDTNRGVQTATPLRILAHELGHLTGTRDNGPGRMNNVNGYENPIMTPIDGLIRTSY